MINSSLDFYACKYIINHRLPTKEIIPNACVGGLVYELEGPQYRKLTMHVCGMCRSALMTLARVAKW